MQFLTPIFTTLERAFLNQQNRLRGLIAGYKSRKFVKERELSPARQFRSGYRSLLLLARQELAPIQYVEFLAWAKEQINTQLQELVSTAVEFDNLSGLIEVPPTSLENELRWITARINIEQDRIIAFRMLVGEVETLCFSMNLSKPAALLEAIERAFGASLWSIQLRIALEQLAGGLERQKRYTAKVRSVYKRGFLSFVAYHTSVRNEGKSTHSKFIEDVKARIDRHQYYDDAIKSYLRQRLANEWPATESGWADVLRIEQSHGMIDIYETYVSAIQELVRRENLLSTRAVAITCLQSLPRGMDFRLDKALLQLDPSQATPKLPNRNTEVSDLLIGGNAQKAAIKGRSKFAKNSIDAWQLIYSGFSLAHRNRPSRRGFSRPREIPQIIANIQAEGASSEDALAQLNKLATNLRGLPFAVAIADFIPHMQRQRPDDKWQPWLISLNCPTVGIEDFPKNSAGIEALDNSAGATHDAWANLHNANYSLNGASRIAADIFAACGLVSDRSFDEAIALLSPLRSQALPEAVRTLVLSLLLHAEVGRGANQNIIELIADECSHSQTTRSLLPVYPTLQNMTWSDFKSVTSPLASAIALKLLWSFNESELTMSQLRFAVGLSLKKCGVDRPSHLRDETSKSPRHQLVYFLLNACIPQVLDVSRVLKSSRQVWKNVKLYLTSCVRLTQEIQANMQTR